MRGLLVIVNYDQQQEIEAFLESLSSMPPALESIVVDDGSTDRSPDIAEDLGFKVVRHATNFGVGASIRTGIQYARASGGFDFVVIMSSNGKMRSSDLPRIIAPILTRDADYVQGTRFANGGRVLKLSAFRRTTIPLYSLISSAVLRRRFTDITCGFRAYTLSMFDDPKVDLNQAWLNHYEAELYIHYHACRKRLRIKEVPVTIDYSHLSPGRESKIRPFAGWWSLARPFLLLGTRLKR
jgi:dolichol-phosphate mannosyltransferase